MDDFGDKLEGGGGDFGLGSFCIWKLGISICCGLKYGSVIRALRRQLLHSCGLTTGCAQLLSCV